MRTIVLLCLFCVTAIVACDDQGDGLIIEDAWVRPGLVDGHPVAAYVTITNNSPSAVTLTGAKSPIATRAELHLSRMHDSVMRMAPVDEIRIPKGGTAVMAPGGYHIMLIGTNPAPQPGDAVAITLMFDEREPLELIAAVERRAMD